MSHNLNKRWIQVTMTLLPVASVSLFTFFPFVWRALRTKKASDIRLAVIFGGAQVLIYVVSGFTDDWHGEPGGNNIVGALLWVLILSAAVTAAWVYRPLNKTEQAAQGRGQGPSGSTYL